MVENTALAGNNQTTVIRVCSECQATNTYSNWRTDGKGGWLCKKCYMRNWFRRRKNNPTGAAAVIYDFYWKSLGDDAARTLSPRGYPVLIPKREMRRRGL